MEARQYNMSVLYSSSSERGVCKRLTGDVDSGITADRESEASSEITDISNSKEEDTEKGENLLEEVGGG